MYNSLYGNYRTRSFSDIYGTVTVFLTDYTECGIPVTISTEYATTLYYLLYSRYGNSHIAASDENRFKYQLCSYIYQYGPAWQKRQEIQTKLRSMTDDELMDAGKAINNHGYNPGTAPSTSSLEELLAINDQTTSHSRRGKLDAYNNLMSLLITDVTGDFLDKFKPLFIKIVAPRLPLWYATNLIDGEDDTDAGQD